MRYGWTVTFTSLPASSESHLASAAAAPATTSVAPAASDFFHLAAAAGASLWVASIKATSPSASGPASTTASTAAPTSRRRLSTRLPGEVKVLRVLRGEKVRLAGQSVADDAAQRHAGHRLLAGRRNQRQLAENVRALAAIALHELHPLHTDGRAAVGQHGEGAGVRLGVRTRPTTRAGAQKCRSQEEIAESKIGCSAPGQTPGLPTPWAPARCHWQAAGRDRLPQDHDSPAAFDELLQPGRLACGGVGQGVLADDDGPGVGRQLRAGLPMPAAGMPCPRIASIVLPDGSNTYNRDACPAAIPCGRGRTSMFLCSA